MAAFGLGAGLQAELFEQDRAELLGGVDLEFVARVFVDRRAEGVELGLQLGGGGAQQRGIELDAVGFHVGEHPDERHFDPAQQIVEAAVGEVFAEVAGQRRQRGGAVGGGGGQDLGRQAGETGGAGPLGLGRLELQLESIEDDVVEGV